MIPFLITIGIALTYALIRAKHDSYILNGGWKTWAFIEAFFIDLVIAGLVVASFGLCWFQVFGLAISFALIFWIFFDCACGWLRHHDILYIGEHGWDQRMREIFHYGRPFLFFKNPRGLKFLLYKLWVSFVFIGGTISILLYHK